MDKQYRIGIVGARIDGQAGVVLDTISYYPQYKVAAFFDFTPSLKGKMIEGIPVLGGITEVSDADLDKVDFFHIAIGDNKARLDIYNYLKGKGRKLLTLIHPSAVVSKRATLGEGCFVGANAVVQTGCKISNVCLINTGSIAEHDNILGDAVHLAPNSATGGRVRLCDMAFVGIGSTLIPDVVVGKSAFVGAGALIRKDVPENTTMIGYSARLHEKNIYQDLADQTEKK